MSDQSETGGRSVRLMMMMVAGGLFALIGGGYLLWTWLAAPPPAPSSINMNNLGSTTQKNAEEQQAYRDLIRENNSRGAHLASGSNQTFIASVPLEQDVIKPEEEKKPPATEKTTGATPPQNNRGGRTQEQMKAIAEARQKGLTTLLSAMQKKPENADLPAAQLLGGKDGGWSAWRDSLPGSEVQLAAARSRQETLNAVPPSVVVAPYWRGPGEICTGVNSDNGATPVLGCIRTGPYAGAVLKAPEGGKLSGDGVIIHFTTMTLRGQAYKIDAYGLDDKTLVANIASDVDHHYGRRILLPAFLKGIGATGELYAQSNTQVLSTGFNSVTARPSAPDGSAVAGVIVGGTAEQAANVLTSDAARMPDRTVTVNHGAIVAIQFMSGVYSTDAEELPGSLSASVNRNTATQAGWHSNPAPTAAELREETQARIRSARQRNTGDTRE
ncbi:TPA: conjugal transfer protein TraO [Enterobacter hormaechei]|nr:conjugal transfer protein TraO [Enterobacter hormaechei]HBM2531194.1 conjugal transfer protein TraO [Enterobacter hormaechei]HBM2647473.1 conjugal transfer protein TraO [Enterobacter hormaechei]HDR1965808.1 conjugal transfer protein TraO [Enterobacter hormaechei]HDR1970093.1 conjugal transfer protein TraO [Enterobacter hormaechei]